jgi:hypothetical protein
VLQRGFALTIELVVFVPFDGVHVSHRMEKGTSLDFLVVPGQGVIEEFIQALVSALVFQLVRAFHNANATYS